MQELMKNKDQRMSSLEIAELTGKNHFDLMRAIRKMEDAWEKVNGCKFALVEYRDAKGELRPCYNLTKTECLYIATKFNDEARAKLVLRWEQLEREKQKMKDEELRLRNFCGQQLLLQTDEDVLQEAERIVGLHLESCNRHADGCITVTEIAKSFGIEAHDLNSFLVDKGIQRWQRGQYRLTEDYEGRGLAQDRLFIYYSKKGKQKERTNLVWTQAGAEFIMNMVGRI